LNAGDVFFFAKEAVPLSAHQTSPALNKVLPFSILDELRADFLLPAIF